jgi:predicted nucleic acid-binding protein
LESLGLKPADALHVADAIRLDADCFLTLDKRVLRQAATIRTRWQLRVVTPAEFLDAVASRQ